MELNPPQHAILQRDKKTYAIVPRIPSGLVQRDHLAAITRVVEKYDIPIVKITSGQRLALVGIQEKDIEAIYHELGMDPGKATELCLHYVQSCPGTEVCKFGVQDSLGFGIRLEQHLAQLEFPAKLKVGVSGCPFCCAESLVRDVGFIGKKTGWAIAIGGHSGNKPRIADIIAENISDNDAVMLITRCLEFYTANAKKKERVARFIERIGLEELKRNVL